LSIHKIIRSPFKLFIIVIGIVIFISCKTNVVNTSKDFKEKNRNYIPYYLKVYEVKEYYDSKNYEKSFAILDSLFSYYEPNEVPTIYEMDIYCELAVLLKKYNKNILKKVLTTTVAKYGRKPYLIGDKDSMWKEVVLHSGIERKDFDSLYNIYLSGINYGLKDTIVEMYKRDQMFRKRDSNYNPIKFDSIDKVNAILLIDVLKKYGYPRENIVGGMELENPVKPNYLSTILMHLDYGFYRSKLEYLLYNELKKGNLCPMDYAMMSDRVYIVNKEKMINYTYLGTYKNLLIQDTFKTNTARKLIGLPDIK
jgi:hypothetical protein